jgi:YHS domain-containing protein
MHADTDARRFLDGTTALGDKVETDCSINTQIAGKTYCFGNEDAMAQFMKDPQGNLAKADSYYSSLR